MHKSNHNKIDYSTLDVGVISLVKYFNENNLPTNMSCQGHNQTNMSMFWIEFSSTVTENDIIQFMKHHLNQYGGFSACGRFVKRIVAFSNNSIYESWQYMAATQSAADEDLKRWCI